jgi:hypothetical protein
MSINVYTFTRKRMPRPGLKFPETKESPLRERRRIARTTTGMMTITK